MNRRQLPLAPFMALAAAAAAQPAAALPPSSSDVAPVRVFVVDDAELAAQNGKYFGASMLVGLRVDLVSTLATPQGNQATAQGTLLVQQSGGGYAVSVDSRSSATAGAGPDAIAAGNVASGGEGVQVDGIGQVTQIAGDGNRMGNLAAISFSNDLGDASGFNGALSSSASDGGLTAQVTFLDGGVQLGIAGAGASLAQQVNTGTGPGQISQLGQIAGNGLVGSNVLQLQLQTAVMPMMTMQQLGVQQALAALSGLPR